LQYSFLFTQYTEEKNKGQNDSTDSNMRMLYKTQKPHEVAFVGDK